MLRAPGLAAASDPFTDARKGNEQTRNKEPARAASRSAVPRSCRWGDRRIGLIVGTRASIAHALALCTYKKISEDALIFPHAGPAGLIQRLVRKRDFYAGLLMIFFGLVMALKGPTYRLGTLMHMGPGFLPTALGALLICLGIAIAATAIPVPEGEDEDILPEHREWFAWVCILCSPLAFMLFGSFFGLAPGTFACVFVAALGDRQMTLKNACILSLFITVLGVALFSYLLQIPMPVFTWRGL